MHILAVKTYIGDKNLDGLKINNRWLEKVNGETEELLEKSKVLLEFIVNYEKKPNLEGNFFTNINNLYFFL